MKFIGKLVSILLVLVVLIIAAATAFVHFYLTDDKIKSLVLPQAEKALGRAVSIGSVDVGLFSGITIHDFAVKERDGEKDFVMAEKFTLSYDLVPLLQKKFVVSELRLDNPSISVIRDKDGNFNFNTIAFLKKAAEDRKKDSERSGSAAKASVPIALTVNTIKITNAKLSLIDHKKELPKTDATANLNVALDIGMDLEKIKYSGDMDLSASALYDGASLLAKLDSRFNQEELSYSADLDIDKEKARIEGKVSNFAAPDIIFNLSSKKLNLDRLLALAAVLPKPEEKEDAPGQMESGPATAIAASMPEGLHVSGLISIQQAVHKKLIIDNFLLEHDLTDGILTVKDLSAKTAGGSLQSTMKIDLNRPDPQYTGSLAIQSIEVSSLGAGLEQEFANILSGALQSTINFAGTGITPETIKKTLSADASYTLSNGRVKNSKITTSIADLTGLPELREISFQDMTGSLKVLEGGVIELISSITATDFSAETTGKVNLDGQLDFPILVKLSETMSQKLDAKGSVTKFLANEKGETEVRLKVSGPVSAPKTSLDSAGVQKQVTETLKAKAADELNRLIMKNQGGTQSPEGTDAPQPPAKPALDLLKGFLGK